MTCCREVLGFRKTAKRRADHVLNFSRLLIFRFLSSTKEVFVFTDTVGIVRRKSENYILKYTAEGYWSLRTFEIVKVVLEIEPYEVSFLPVVF